MALQNHCTINLGVEGRGWDWGPSLLMPKAKPQRPAQLSAPAPGHQGPLPEDQKPACPSEETLTEGERCHIRGFPLIVGTEIGLPPRGLPWHPLPMVPSRWDQALPGLLRPRPGKAFAFWGLPPKKRLACTHSNAKLRCLVSEEISPPKKAMFRAGVWWASGLTQWARSTA